MRPSWRWPLVLLVLLGFLPLPPLEAQSLPPALAAIARATPGTSIVVPSGRYQWAGRLTLPRGVSLRAAPGAQVTLIGNWEFQGQQQIEGLTFIGGGAGANFIVSGDSVTLQRNTIIPHARNGPGLTIRNNAAHTRILDNEIRVAYAHNNSIGANANDTLIANNRFTRGAAVVECPAGDCGEHIAMQSGWNGVAGRYLTIANNQFVSLPTNWENYVDLKAPAPRAVGGYRILNNLFGDHPGACLLLWGQAAGSSGLVQEVTGNTLGNCGRARPGGAAIVLYDGPGGSGRYPRPEGEGFRVARNILRCQTAGSRGIRVAVRGATVTDNQLGDCPEQPPLPPPWPPFPPEPPRRPDRRLACAPPGWTPPLWPPIDRPPLLPPLEPPPVPPAVPPTDPPPPTVGTTYYVAPSGNNSVSCAAARSASQPKATLASALACLQPGDTLILAGGVYPETLRNSIPSGTPGRPVTLRAAPGATVILQPSAGQVVLSLTNRQYIVLDGLTLDGRNVRDNVVRLEDGSNHHIQVLNSTIRRSPNGAACASTGRGNSDLLFRNVTIQDCGGGSEPARDLQPGKHGLYWHADNSVIEHSRFTNFTGYCIQYYDGQDGAITNNIFQYNFCSNTRNKGGVMVAGMAVNTRILHNTITNTGGPGIQVQGRNTTVAHNTIRQTRGVAIQDRGQGTVLIQNRTTP